MGLRHRRLTTRTVRTSTQMNDWFAKEWIGIAQTFEVTRTVTRKRRKVIEHREAAELAPPNAQGTPAP